jgi:3-methyladenine DNA glycosylase/8-oxoguanine DNA glycosylase
VTAGPMRFPTPLPVDLVASLRPLVASASDPTIRLRPDRLLRAARTPEGPATLEVRQLAPDRFEARAFGPGGAWAVDAAPGLVGARDDLTGFDPSADAVVARAHHRRPGLRIIRSGRVEDVLVPTLLAQRVTSLEAARSWTRLVLWWGEPAPGPGDLRVPPSPDQLTVTPTWAFAELDVERSRAVRIRSACRAIERLQAAVDEDPTAAFHGLTSVPGVGVWTAAHLRRVVAGDPDAVEVGDHNTKDWVGWNLAGEPRASDARMMQLLAPFTGHRGRVVRLLLSTGQRPPRYGPRYRIVPLGGP